MRKAFVLLGVLACTPFTANSVEWFEANTPLTQAHQHLLNDNLPGMFNSLVEVFQRDQSPAIRNHLNDLLIQALEADCGQSLDNKQLPDWVSSVIVRRSNIQSPGRDAYRANVLVSAKKEIQDISLKRWVDKPLSTDASFFAKPSDIDLEQPELVYQKRYNLNSRVQMGLYRLDITAKDQETWSSWIVLGDAKAKQVVRWASKDQWVIEKRQLLNDYCPLPKLTVALYDYVDGKYDEVWSNTYESDYPMSLDSINIDPDRYVLAVSMSHQRWQGQIIIEQSQIISKTYDVSVEE
ncbi:DUF2861 family protein [Vibrio paucivorans]|uniref:DUF2861 family protein n=1 Tax=Vibrio paucivorans TaxID=2829489 RepID=A0A9X3CJJ3_9VIBR|nr:DUF2861 family protein [Vibrio paucivorans]MCW8335960.1 DUF2861 family protein [Vibrio paucivorans]